MTERADGPAVSRWLGVDEQTADRVATICSHLGIFALGASFGIRIAGAKLSPLCRPTVLAETPCTPIVESLRAVDFAAMGGGAVLILLAVVLVLPEWRESSGGDS